MGEDGKEVVQPGFGGMARLLMEDEGEEAARFSGYVVERELGRGGGGTVYKVFREGSEYPLALKLMTRGVGATAAGTRSWRELDVLSQLRFEGVPRVVDYGVHAGRLYIVTDYVEGRTLEEVRGELSERERVEVLARLAGVVQELHERGVIHRDIKPSNVMVASADGRPVLIDLGIATLAEDTGATLTQEGAPIGSPAFMSPEQARGERQAVSVRTDVYGLGATCLYVLTGRPPCEAGSVSALVGAIAQGQVRDEREWGLDKGLTAVLRKALCAEAKGRYATAGEMGEDLERWLRGERVLAAGAGRWQRAVRWVGRRPVLTSVVVSLLAAVLIVGTAGGTVWWMRSTPSHVMLSGDRRMATLMTAAGEPVRTWDAGKPALMAMAELLEVPSRLGGGKAVVLGAGRGLVSMPNVQACAVRATRDGEVLWAVKGTDVITPEDRRRPTDHYVLVRIEVWEGFLAGEPVVATAWRGEVRSQSVLQVRDLGGKVVYEAWHDGRITGMRWLPGVRRVVLSAVHSTHEWHERGRPDLTRMHPLVVFALDADVPAVGWVGEGTPGVAWYRCVLPAESTDLFSETWAGAPVAGFGEDHVRVRVSTIKEGYAAYFTLNALGEVVDFHPDTELVRKYPWTEGLRLGELPRVVVGSAIERQSDSATEGEGEEEKR